VIDMLLFFAALNILLMKTTNSSSLSDKATAGLGHEATRTMIIIL